MTTPLNGSILKSFEILRLVRPDRPDLTAAILQTELEMTFATAHRLLATLAEAGALVAVRRGCYRLSPTLAELGRLADETNPLAPRLQPLIDALRDQLGESVMVCRLTRAGPTCIAVAPADRPITVGIRVGSTLSLTRSAQGRLWLAGMTAEERAAAGATEDFEAIRSQGFARNIGDAEPDIAAIAAPIRDGRGKVVLTVSAFGLLTRFDATFQDRALDGVLDTARRIEAALSPKPVLAATA